MEIKDLKQHDTALPRKEIVATITYPNTTPSRLQIKEKIASKANTKPELLIIKQIKPVYGEKKSTITAYAYKDETSMKDIEYKESLAKNTSKEKKSAEQQSTDEQPAVNEGEQ